MEKAVILWLCRMDGKHLVFAECCWGNHVRFTIWEREKGRKNIFSALVWLFVLGYTVECWFHNILASITVAILTVNELRVIRDPTCRSGRVMCGR